MFFTKILKMCYNYVKKNYIATDFKPNQKI
ncbi:hypothetical protein SAMN05444395_104110 [Flavobacterium fryxellicola]|nr:hypothetical protein SAMN05444395_104110 [Flavobacterium fryxellicola]